jgi:tellurite resistance protein
MFNPFNFPTPPLEFKFPTYKEWKEGMEKIMKKQPELYEKYNEQVQQFCQDWFEDVKNKDQ